MLITQIHEELRTLSVWKTGFKVSLVIGVLALPALGGDPQSGWVGQPLQGGWRRSPWRQPRQGGFQYLGRVTSNLYDPDSVARPFAPYAGGRVRNSVTMPSPGFANRSGAAILPVPRVVSPRRVYGSKVTYLGKLSSNRYGRDSTSNPYGRYGSRYSPVSINNPHGAFGSRYSPTSANNPRAVDTPRLYGADRTYLGKLSSNQYDPDSISNPYGRYGSKYSSDSIRNPYGRFGSRYSSTSSNNPYTTDAPRIVWP